MKVSERKTDIAKRLLGSLKSRASCGGGIKGLVLDDELAIEDEDFKAKMEKCCRMGSGLLTEALSSLDPQIRAVTIDPSEIKYSGLDPCRDIYNQGKFAVFPDITQWKALTEMVMLAFDHENYPSIFHGPTQIGKALLLAAARQIIPELWYLIKGQPAVGLISVMSDKNHLISTTEEDRWFNAMFRGCYVTVSFRNGKKKRRKVGESNFLLSLHNVDGVVMRERYHVGYHLKKIPHLNSLTKFFHFLDEIDRGSALASVEDKYLRTIFEQHIFGVTATPSEFIGLGLPVYLMSVPMNWRCWVPFYLGKEIRSIDGSKVGILEVREIESSFPLMWQAADRGDVLGVAAELFRFTKHKVDSLPHPEGNFVRFSRLVDDSERLAQAIERHLSSNSYPIDVVRHFGDADCIKNGQALKPFLIDKHRAGRFTITIATSHGRAARGDSMPKETKDFLILTKEPGYMDTDLQRDLGRGSGRGKESVLYTRATHADRIAHMIANGGEDKERHFSLRALNIEKECVTSKRTPRITKYTPIFGD